MGIEMLAKELHKIRSPDIRDFVILGLGCADPRFWSAPCSSTGKYHPPEDQGKGGLVRHIIKGTLIVEQFARRAQFGEYELDLALASFMLHDVCKDGLPPWGQYTDYTHGLLAYNWLQQFRLDDRHAKQAILDAVRYHMAPWCYSISPYRQEGIFTKEEMLRNLDEMARALVSPSRIELAVREADYWSTREGMSYMPGVSIVYDPRVHDSPDEWLGQIKGFSDSVQG